MPDFLKRITSRPFMLAVAAAFGAVGATVSTFNTPGIPVDKKVETLWAAGVAISFVVGVYTHSETKKDGVIAAAQIEADSNAAIYAPVPPDLKGLLINHLKDAVELEVEKRADVK